jgi:hypothetical protein
MTRFATCTILSRKLGITAVLIGSMLLSSPTRGQTTKTQGGAEIISVGPISPKALQGIVVTGRHFGMSQPFNGCSDFIRVTDLMNNEVLGLFAPGPQSWPRSLMGTRSPSTSSAMTYANP